MTRKKYIPSGQLKANRNVRVVLGVVFTGLCVLGVLAINGTFVPIIKADECDSGNPDFLGETIIVIDASDTWSVLRRQIVENQLLDDVGIHQRVLVYAVESGVSDQSVAEPLIEICNPGTLAALELEYEGRAYGVRSGIMDDRYRAFKDSVLEIVDAVAARPSIDDSPIMETLLWAATKSSHDSLEVFLVSDLLQNTGEYSLYGGNADLSEEMAAALAGEDRLGTEELEGARVSLYMLLNRLPTGVSRNSLVRFWTVYLAKQGRGRLSEGEGAEVVFADQIS
jgi:hypothetical protein